MFSPTNRPTTRATRHQAEIQETTSQLPQDAQPGPSEARVATPDTDRLDGNRQEQEGEHRERNIHKEEERP
jgi:hypothetical protein